MACLHSVVPNNRLTMDSMAADHTLLGDVTRRDFMANVSKDSCRSESGMTGICHSSGDFPQELGTTFE